VALKGNLHLFLKKLNYIFPNYHLQRHLTRIQRNIQSKCSPQFFFPSFGFSNRDRISLFDFDLLLRAFDRAASRIMLERDEIDSVVLKPVIAIRLWCLCNKCFLQFLYAMR